MKWLYRSIAALTLLAALFWASEAASASTVVAINTDSASEVLRALQNKELGRAESVRIALLPGNQGVIRKTIEFGAPASTENLADALYKAAHNLPSSDPVSRFYQFDLLKPKLAEAEALLREIKANPEAFQHRVEQRIAQFSPSHSDIHLQGFIIAAGDGGGYAFGGADFYLNLVMTNEFVAAKLTMEHELYHAVQGVYAKSRGSVNDLPALDGLSTEEQTCLRTQHLFDNIYEEGSAKYVEEPVAASEIHSENGRKQQQDMADNVRHAATSAFLLEMSVISLSGKRAMRYDDVYDVGFYGHGILYSIAYVMVKAIADEDGSESVTKLLTTPSSQFVLRYTRLKQYGKDADHPMLGPNTIAAADRIVKECHRDSRL